VALGFGILPNIVKHVKQLMMDEGERVHSVMRAEIASLKKKGNFYLAVCFVQSVVTKLHQIRYFVHSSAVDYNFKRKHQPRRQLQVRHW